jgi:DNA polymerase-1
MKFDSSTLTEQTKLSSIEADSIYNALDCCVTYEVFEELNQQIRNRPQHQQIYNFSRGLQAPALDMMQRGWKIDGYERGKNIDLLTKRLVRLESLLNDYATAVWGKPLNAKSPDQLKSFFYRSMEIPEVELSFRGVRRVSVNREALEKISNYFYALPIVKVIFEIRKTSKLLSVLKAEVDSDGRIRTSYNIAGTETGRWSSSQSVWGSGTNLQNITPELRRMFVADPGWKLCHLDLEQAESRVVGFLLEILFEDRSYTEAHESGDLHTTNAILIWPDKVHNREEAEEPYYFQYSYRDMAKRCGHATNYDVSAWTLSRHLHIPIAIADEFQKAYHRAYPGIKKWHTYCAGQVQMHSLLQTPLGRVRQFFGRPGDTAVIREAIAYCPQSTVADLLNIILWIIWKFMPEVQLLGQTHDSIDFQFKEGTEEATIEKLKSLIKLVIDTPQATLSIPIEIKTGWNWAEQTRPPFTKLTNPDGLMKYIGTDTRTRPDNLDRLV